MLTLSKISDLRRADYNPRKISDEALYGLKKSIEAFGDLSGIVWNSRTGNLVCGHQRLESLKGLYGQDLKIEEYMIKCPDGNTFPIRVVDMDEAQEKIANITANNPHISGEFDIGKLQELLEESQQAASELYDDLRLDELEVTKDGIPKLKTVVPKPKSFAWLLACVDSSDVSALMSAKEKIIEHIPDAFADVTIQARGADHGRED